jgi:hypothetical protein
VNRYSGNNATTASTTMKRGSKKLRPPRNLSSNPFHPLYLPGRISF